MLPRVVAAVKTWLGNQHGKHIMTKKRMIVGLLAKPDGTVDGTAATVGGRGRLNGEVLMRRNLMVLASVLTIVGGTQAAQAQVAEPVQNTFGIGVSLGGWHGVDSGITAFYAVPFDNDLIGGTVPFKDLIGIEINGTFAQGGDTIESDLVSVDQDFSLLSFGSYATIRYSLTEDIDLIGLGGIRYLRYDYESSRGGTSVSVDNSGFFFDLGAAAEYKLGNTSAIRGQLVTGGSFDILYVIKL